MSVSMSITMLLFGITFPIFLIVLFDDFPGMGIVRKKTENEISESKVDETPSTTKSEIKFAMKALGMTTREEFEKFSRTFGLQTLESNMYTMGVYLNVVDNEPQEVPLSLVGDPNDNTESWMESSTKKLGENANYSVFEQVYRGTEQMDPSGPIHKETTYLVYQKRR